MKKQMIIAAGVVVAGAAIAAGVSGSRGSDRPVRRRRERRPDHR